MTLSRIETVEWEIDTHLLHLLQDIEETPEEARELCRAIARAAWGAGYVFAWSEPVPGGFAARHGYDLPERKQAA